LGLRAVHEQPRINLAILVAVVADTFQPPAFGVVAGHNRARAQSLFRLLTASQGRHSQRDHHDGHYKFQKIGHFLTMLGAAWWCSAPSLTTPACRLATAIGSVCG